MKNTLIGIDPGCAGGIAVYRPWHQVPFETHKMPESQGDVLDLLRTIRAQDMIEQRDTACALEQVGGFAGVGQPGSAMFKFGENFGFVKGVLQALNIKLVLVRPQAWQKHFSLGTARSCASKTEWKNKLKAEAARRFPAIKVTLNTSDALLILDWARQQPDFQ